MKKFVIFLLFLLTLAIAGLLMNARGNEDSWVCENGQWIKHGNPATAMPTTGCSEKTANVAVSVPQSNAAISPPVTVQGQARIFENNLTVRIKDANDKILAQEKVVVTRSDIEEDGDFTLSLNFDKPTSEKGTIEVFQNSAKNGSEIDKVTVPVKFANFQKNNELVSLNDSVKLKTPKANDEISNPLSIEGEAKGTWYFEASFPARVLDANRKVLGTAPAQAQGEWMTESFVPFKTSINFSVPETDTGYLVLQKDNPSDLRELDQSVEIPIKFKKDLTTVKVYFPNNIKNPEMLDCSLVFSSDRQVTKTTAVAKAAIEELLKGPTGLEKQAGYFTSLNSGIKLQSISIDANGTAHVDFDQQLQAGVGGSCKVSAIRSQIEKTLKQFSTVKRVIISINGDSELILQP